MLNKNTPKYVFQPSFLVTYPWLVHVKDEALSKINCQETFYCKCCRAFPRDVKCAFSQWVSGWTGGKDGYWKASLKLYSDSADHLALLARFDRANNDPIVLQIEAATMQKWRETIPQKTIDVISNRMKAVKYVTRKRLAGRKFRQNFNASIVFSEITCVK